MLKIDLLPSYVRERRKVKPAIILVVVIILVEVALLLGASMKVKGAIAATQKELDEIEPVAKQVESLEAEAQSELATVKPAIDRVKYYEDMAKLGDQFVKLIDAVNEYIYEKVTVQNFQTDGSSVSFTAVTDSTESFGRFLLNFLRCPAVTNVSVSTNIGGGGGAGGGAMPGVPGIPGGGPGMPPGIGGPPGGAAAPVAGGGAELITVNVSCTVTPDYKVTVPTLGGAAPAAAPGGMGMGAMPGAPGMVPGIPGAAVPGAGPPLPPGAGGPGPGLGGPPPGSEVPAEGG